MLWTLWKLPIVNWEIPSDKNWGGPPTAPAWLLMCPGWPSIKYRGSAGLETKDFDPGFRNHLMSSPVNLLNSESLRRRSGSGSRSFLNNFWARVLIGLKFLGILEVRFRRQAENSAKLGSAAGSARCQGRMPKRQKNTTMPNWKISWTLSTYKKEIVKKNWQKKKKIKYGKILRQKIVKKIAKKIPTKNGKKSLKKLEKKSWKNWQKSLNFFLKKSWKKLAKKYFTKNSWNEKITKNVSQFISKNFRKYNKSWKNVVAKYFKIKKI